MANVHGPIALLSTPPPSLTVVLYALRYSAASLKKMSKDCKYQRDSSPRRNIAGFRDDHYKTREPRTYGCEPAETVVLPRWRQIYLDPASLAPERGERASEAESMKTCSSFTCNETKPDDSPQTCRLTNFNPHSFSCSNALRNFLS
jgi:hypothetical protein